MARETINGISVPIPDTGEPPDFVADLRRIASEAPNGFARRVQGVSAAQNFLATLERGATDLTALALADSTANDPVDWFELWVEDLRAQWLTHTFMLYRWDFGTSAYLAPITLQTGTGARTVHIYNGAASGQNADYHLGHITAVCAAVQPDLVFIGHGHNMSSNMVNFRASYTELVSAVAHTAPRAGIICLSQNPVAAGNTAGLPVTASAVRADVIAQVSRDLGAGFIDVHQAFQDYGDWATDLLQVDGLHPTFTDNGSGVIGYQFWADYVAAHFIRDHDNYLLPRQPSPLATGTENLLDNGDFFELDALAVAVATATPVLPGWVVSGAAVPTRDGTVAENHLLQSVKLATTGAGHIRQALPLECRGHLVTLTVRMWIDAAADSSAGRIAIGDSLGSTTTDAEVKGRGAWRTYTVSRYIAATATAPTAYIYAQTNASGSSNVYVSWANVSRGGLPKRPLPRRNAADTLYIPAGAFSAVGGSPTLGTVGTRSSAWLFPDATDDNWIATSLVPPRGWNTFEVQIIGANAGAGSGNVAMTVESRVLAVAGSLTAAVGATQDIINAAAAQNVQQTLSNRVPGSGTGTGTFSMTRFTTHELFVRRKGALAGDTLANDYAVLGVRLLRLT